MSKFRKIAALPTKNPTDLKSIMNAFLGSQDDVSQFLTKSNLQNNLQFLAALFPGWTDRYSPSAFYHALEFDDNRGYKGTQHSQGAYELMDPKIMEQVEKFKKNPPKDLKDLVTDKPIENLNNINLPETSGRYKAMEEKLYPKTSNSEPKFVKTSQTSRANDLKKIVPNWTIENVLKDMARVANRQDLSSTDKQQAMMNVLAQYEKSIAPLSQFLDKNGIQYK